MTNTVDHFSEEELISSLRAARSLVEIGGRYAHYRNPQCIYKVTGLVLLEASQEPAVQYHKESASAGLDTITWIRSISSWLEEVSVDNKLVKRFQRITNSAS